MRIRLLSRHPLTSLTVSFCRRTVYKLVGGEGEREKGRGERERGGEGKEQDK